MSVCGTHMHTKIQSVRVPSSFRVYRPSVGDLKKKIAQHTRTRIHNMLLHFLQVRIKVVTNNLFVCASSACVLSTCGPL